MSKSFNYCSGGNLNMNSFVKAPGELIFGREYAGISAQAKYLLIIMLARFELSVKNNWKDKDNGWKTLIRIPLAELRKNGMKFAPGEKWTIFIARYNYSRFLPTCEYSGVPQKFAHFHVLSDYAKLIIKSAE